VATRSDDESPMIPVLAAAAAAGAGAAATGAVVLAISGASSERRETIQKWVIGTLRKVLVEEQPLEFYDFCGKLSDHVVDFWNSHDENMYLILMVGSACVMALHLVKWGPDKLLASICLQQEKVNVSSHREGFSSLLLNKRDPMIDLSKISSQAALSAADYESMRTLKELPENVSPEVAEAVRAAGARLHDELVKRGDKLDAKEAVLLTERKGAFAQVAVVAGAAVSAGALCKYLIVQRPA
jgi:hypothetical protein